MFPIICEYIITIIVQLALQVPFWNNTPKLVSCSYPTLNHITFYCRYIIYAWNKISHPTHHQPVPTTTIRLSFHNFTQRVQIWDPFFITTYVVTTPWIKNLLFTSHCLIVFYIHHQQNFISFIKLYKVCFLFHVRTLVLVVSQLITIPTLNHFLIEHMSPSYKTIVATKLTSTSPSDASFFIFHL